MFLCKKRNDKKQCVEDKEVGEPFLSPFNSFSLVLGPFSITQNIHYLGSCTQTHIKFQDLF